MSFSRTPLILFALAFFIIALLNLFVAVQVVEHPLLSGAQTVGTVTVCTKIFPTMEMNSSFTLFEGVPFLLQVNFTNRAGSAFSFTDDAFFFNIGAGTGLINFTPNVSSVGQRSVIISYIESGASCYNQILSAFVTFNIYGNSTLAIWDETDPKGGSKVRHAIDRVLFFANYTANNGSLIRQGDAGCYARYNISGNVSNYYPMEYNSTFGLYVSNVTPGSNGNFTYGVQCNSTNSYFAIANATDSFNIYNNPPVLIANYPNQSWNANTVLFGPRLGDYFLDTDGDTLNFTATTVSSVNITIDSLTGVVKFTPATNFYGNRTVHFIASDGFGGVTQTDYVYLFIIYVIPAASTSSGTSSGGGGGGGGAVPAQICDESWACGQYGPCLSSGIRARTCNDQAECGTSYYRPNESMLCTYTPSCSDQLRNQAELGVDCGGPCPACPTCEDKIQNQGELGLDCGGPCPACSSCYDNIQNQGETGLDCGGPCGACPSCFDKIMNQGEAGVDCGGPCSKVCLAQEQPAGINVSNMRLLGVLLFLAVLVLVGSALTYKYVWPRLVPMLVKKRSYERISFFEVLMQTERELALVRRRANHAAPKEIIEDVADLLKTFFYHYFDLDTPFSFNLMGILLEQHQQPPKLNKELLQYSKEIMELQYAQDISLESAFIMLSRAERLIGDCAKAAGPRIAQETEALVRVLLGKCRIAHAAGNSVVVSRHGGRVKRLVSALSEADKKKFLAELALYEEK